MKWLAALPAPLSPQSLGVTSWPTWGCEASNFPWSYSSTETAYVLKGRVIVTPDGGEPVEVKAGDLVTFPVSRRRQRRRSRRRSRSAWGCAAQRCDGAKVSCMGEMMLGPHPCTHCRCR